MPLDGEVLSDGSTGPGGGTGGGGATGGGDPAFSGGGQSGTPQAVELTNDSYIRVPGVKDPVKYSDYIKGFVPKADFTRSTQNYSQQLKQAQAEIARRDQALQQYQSQQQSAQPQQNPLAGLLADLKQRTYIDGAGAAQIVESLYNGGIVPLAQAIQQRDELLNMLYRQLTQVNGAVGKFQGARTEEAFAQKRASIKSNLKLPDDPIIDEMIWDVYGSHEGEDLDNEIENMVKQRWDNYQRLIRASDQRRAAEGRSRLFKPSLEGAGGNATPSRPLKGGFKDAKQLADDLWPMLGGVNT